MIWGGNMAKAIRSKAKECKTPLKGVVKDKRYNVVGNSVGHVKGSEMVIHEADGRIMEITKVASKIMKKYDKAFYELSKK